MPRNHSTTDIYNWKFNDADMPEEWKKHLGNLPQNARILIKGRPKNGKTEYCMKLSVMFAKSNSKVSYNSPEQGRSRSFQEAAKRNVLNEVKGGKWMLCGKQCHNFDAWFKYLERPNSGRVIFLDSIDRMKITEEQYIQLDKRFPNKMIVMVCWNNPMAASSKAIEYYVDAVIEVKDFIAESFSRYGGNEPFIIWDRKQKPAQTSLFQKQN